MKNKIQSLFWGILAAGAALFLELLLSLFIKINYLETVGALFIIIIASSVVIEEILKYIVILKNIDSFSFGRGAIINAWIAGVGFSLVEILFFYQKTLTEDLIFNQIDLINIVLLHIFTFGIFGYRIAIREDNRLNIGTLFVVILLHFTYNMSTQYTDKIPYFVGNLVLLVLISYNLLNFITVNKRLAHE